MTIRRFATSWRHNGLRWPIEGLGNLHRRHFRRTPVCAGFEPSALAHLRQQLLPKLLLAQTPTTPNRLELLAFLRTAPFLYVSISRTDPFLTPFLILSHQGFGQSSSRSRRHDMTSLWTP